MSPLIQTRRIHARGFPRVSGDEPPIDAIRSLALAFSPRERG